MKADSEAQADQRAYPRYEYRVDVGILGLRPTSGVTVDISRGGVKIDLPEQVSDSTIGKQCRVLFLDAGDELKPHYAVGKVRRVDANEGRCLVAIQFLTPLKTMGLGA